MLDWGRMPSTASATVAVSVSPPAVSVISGTAVSGVPDAVAVI